MNHEQAQRSISGYLRGELSPAERQVFLTHVNSCPRCESELAIATRLHTELPVAAPYNVKGIAPLPGPLASRVRQAVYAQERRRRPLGWLDWLFPGAQPSLPRLFANVLGVFVLLAAVAIGAVALRNAFQPGPNKPGYAADFTYAQQQGLTYVFTDTTVTTDQLTYAWDFGDGGKATLRNPIHTYGMTGVYTVSMTVSGPRGGNSKDHSVIIGNAVVVTLSPTPSPSPTMPSWGTATSIPPQPQNTITAPPAPINTLAPAPPTMTQPSFNPTPSLLPSATPLPTQGGPQPLPTRPVPGKPSATPYPSATGTRQVEPSHTPLPWPSNTPLPTATQHSVPSSTPLPPTSTLLPTHQPSSTPLPTHQPSSTPLPTQQPSNTPLPEPTHTPRPEPSSTPHQEPSSTPLPPTSTPVEPSETPEPTQTHEPSATPQPTQCGDACNTPIPTNTPDCQHDCQTPQPTATHQLPPTNTPAEPTHPPTETPQPPPTETHVEATETPGPTCTPIEGEPNQHGC